MISEEFNDLIEEIKRKIGGKKDVETIIVFGSIARGEANARSDVDVCVVQLLDVTEEISNIILDIEKKYDRNINVVFTDRMFSGLDRQFIEAILREGIVVYGKIPPVSIQRLELEPYEIIRYDLSALSQSDKMRIKRLLYGAKTKKVYKGKTYESERRGLVKDFGGLRIGIASILIPERASWVVEKLLREYDIKIRKITIWLSKP